MTSAPDTNSPSAPALRRVRPLLVTGGAGFIGCNLADRLALEGEHVAILDTLGRSGVERNLAWLKRRHPRHVAAVIADVRSPAAAEAVTDAAGVFHLAAQVAVTTSLADPARDFDVNLCGTLNLLEAARRRSRPPTFVFASTNKVYGDLADIAVEPRGDAVVPLDATTRRLGISEDWPLSFHTPYGCSKGAADQYVLEYARAFGVPTAVLRMSCTYGPRQLGTEDQGWVAHFLMRACDNEPIIIYGDGRQVRDVLYVDDAVEAYVKAFRRIGRGGHAYNLGGGPGNAVSLRQVLAQIEALLGRHVEVGFAGWRPGDQRYYVSDNRRITHALGLVPPRSWREGLRRLADWVKQSRSTRAEPALRASAETAP